MGWFTRKPREQRDKEHKLYMAMFGLEQLLKWLELVKSYDAHEKLAEKNELLQRYIARLDETRTELQEYQRMR